MYFPLSLVFVEDVFTTVFWICSVMKEFLNKIISYVLVTSCARGPNSMNYTWKRDFINLSHIGQSCLFFAIILLDKALTN